jgi:hypothetical protein
MQLPRGAIATLISRAATSDVIGRVAGLTLQPLQSALVRGGAAAIEIPSGAALLVASRP